jgi:threonine synthase
MMKPLAAMKTIYAANGYIEPHGAVGYLGLKRITKPY